MEEIDEKGKGVGENHLQIKILIDATKLLDMRYSDQEWIHGRRTMDSRLSWKAIGFLLERQNLSFVIEWYNMGLLNSKFIV
ncbi:hypothetical protein Csa_008704 [Cucumis sativus]|uniref:Uncharacterized protein n=1 Tax=Cucumis sativus TaxID=3659 RepID=A0A0A0KQM8_CUCSA|nr:hypothetical protein Csa_008704 [Cucumis sativus]